MNGFGEIGQNGRFRAKMTIFGPKWRKRDFFAKKQNCHFLTFIEPGLHEKNQKNLMRGFLGNCDRRTNGWTNVRTSVNP